MVGCRPTTVIERAEPTIAELCRSYKQYAESYYRHGGTTHNIKTAIRKLRETYGDTLAAEFGPLALKSVRQRFVDDGQSRTYCNRLTDIIRRMFKWASSEQLVPVSTWQALTTVVGLRCGHTEAPETEPILPIDEGTGRGHVAASIGYCGGNGEAATANRNAAR